MPLPSLVVVAFFHDRRLRYDTFVFFVDLSNNIVRLRRCSIFACCTRCSTRLHVNSSKMPRMASSRFKGRRGRFEICASTCFGSHHPSSSTCDVDEPRSMLRITRETKQTAESESPASWHESLRRFEFQACRAGWSRTQVSVRLRKNSSALGQNIWTFEAVLWAGTPAKQIERRATNSGKWLWLKLFLKCNRLVNMHNSVVMTWQCWKLIYWLQVDWLPLNGTSSPRVERKVQSENGLSALLVLLRVLSRVL